MNSGKLETLSRMHALGELGRVAVALNPLPGSRAPSTPRFDGAACQ